MKRKMYFIIFLVIVTGLISISFKPNYIYSKAGHNNYPGGASANLGAGYTGASWDNNGHTCSQSGCHGGGTFSTGTTIVLLSGTTAVAKYIPGTVYIFSIKIAASSGSPKYGFNAMCATATAHENINKWGIMPAGTQNTMAGKRNYIEQISARTATGGSPTSSYTVNAPWTAPASGTGSVTFYAEGMAVNGSCTVCGDSPAPPVNLTITESSTLPVKISAVTAQKINNGINISWTSEQEINTSFYTVEYSRDGTRFAPLGNVSSVANNTGLSHSYTYTDNNLVNGKHFYRIVEVDMDGSKTYSQVITINVYNKKTFTIIPNPVADFINLPTNQLNGSFYLLTGINGRKIAEGEISGNKINVASLVHGTYILTVIEKTGDILSNKFIKE